MFQRYNKYSYIHPEYTIKLYDNQGFENDDTVKI